MHYIRNVFTQYGQSYVGICLVNDDGSFIAFGEDEENPHYQAYLKWLEEGNEVLPADEPASE